MVPKSDIERFIQAIIDDGDAPSAAKCRIEQYLTDILEERVSTLEPVFRIEYYLAKISGADVELPEPISNADLYLSALAGAEVTLPDTPNSSLEEYLAKWCETGAHSTDKNLLNTATNITGYYISSSGNITASDDAQYTDLIPVTQGEEYVCSLVSGRNNGTNRWHGYDANGGWVKQLAFVSASEQQGARLVMAATIDSGISYVRLSYGITDTEATLKILR